MIEQRGTAPAVYEASDRDLAQAEEMGNKKTEITSEIKKVIVGQEKVIEEILIALFCRGHCLLVGVPGLAKTLLISTLAGIMELTFNRVQFTPDLMPSDITGTDILEEEMGSKRRRSFRFIKGPIFTNILLADEINRTPPKTQAALLQAMQEYKVTAGGVTHPLDLPFFVLATQNPIEQEGTYPLPEAQLDRFMFNIGIDYPPFEQEMEIVATTTSSYQPSLHKVINGEKILEMQELVRRVPASSHVIGYAVNLLRSTRPQGAGGPALRERLGGVGSGAEGLPAPDPGGQGQGHPARQVRGLGGGCQGGGPFHPEAQDHHQLQGPGRGDHLAGYHRPSSGRGKTLNHFDPQVLAKLKNLYLRARFVVDGVMVGIHPSRAKGFSSEFEEHREYSQGDDVRHIDWKAYGKFDRYFIKEYREATNLKAYLLLDASSSMSYASDGWSKFDYGSTLAASLAYLMLKQQDAVGLITFSNRIDKMIPPKAVSRAPLRHPERAGETKTRRGDLGGLGPSGAGRLPEEARDHHPHLRPPGSAGGGDEGTETAALQGKRRDRLSPAGPG